MAPPTRPRLFFVPFRILIITFALTALTMAVSLMGGLLFTLISASLHGVQPDVASAYRNIAFPVIRVASVIAFLVASVMEVRYYLHHRRLK